MYKIGDTFKEDLEFKWGGELSMYYVLVQVKLSAVTLIGLESWNRQGDPPVKVKNVHAITNVEFKKISYGGKFKRCNKQEAFVCLLRECVGE